MLEELSDQELLENSGKQAAFRTFYNRYWEALYRKAVHRFGNSKDAEDAVQEIFLSLWRNMGNLQIEETLAPYLFAALKYYTIKQAYLKAKRGDEVELFPELSENPDLTTEDVMQFRELQKHIFEKVNQLPDRMREVYQLSRNENLKIAEIAVFLNISERTVKNTLTTALRRLRESLSKSRIFCFFL